MAKQAPHQRSMKAQIMNSNKRTQETWGDQPWSCRRTDKGLSGRMGRDPTRTKGSTISRSATTSPLQT